MMDNCLPATGSDTATAVVLAAVLVIGGIALVRSAHRRRGTLLAAGLPLVLAAGLTGQVPRGSEDCTAPPVTTAASASTAAPATDAPTTAAPTTSPATTAPATTSPATTTPATTSPATTTTVPATTTTTIAPSVSVLITFWVPTDERVAPRLSPQFVEPSLSFSGLVDVAKVGDNQWLGMGWPDSSFTITGPIGFVGPQTYASCGALTGTFPTTSTTCVISRNASNAWVDVYYPVN